MSYPTPVRFVRAEPGQGGMALRWKAPDTTESVTGYVVYRSTRPIAEAETEAFYSGQLEPAVARFVRPVQPPAFFDPEPPSPAWYLIQATTAGGDLLDVEATLAPIADSGVYEKPPDLVFRDDDPAAGIQIVGTAKAMARRLDRDSSE